MNDLHLCPECKQNHYPHLEKAGVFLAFILVSGFISLALIGLFTLISMFM